MTPQNGSIPWSNLVKKVPSFFTPFLSEAIVHTENIFGLSSLDKVTCYIQLLPSLLLSWTSFSHFTIYSKICRNSPNITEGSE
jgi:hypothetical protein